MIIILLSIFTYNRMKSCAVIKANIKIYTNIKYYPVALELKLFYSVVEVDGPPSRRLTYTSFL